MDAEGFWSRVKVEGPMDCWEWQSYRNEHGYGSFAPNGRGSPKVLTHRWSYATAHGLDVLKMDGIVRHTCDNPPCVNPAHLLIGTQADNMQDMRLRGRARPWRSWRGDVCHNGHTGEILVSSTGKRSCRHCKRDYDRARYLERGKR